jgi:molecular chaperone GrpE
LTENTIPTQADNANNANDEEEVQGAVAQQPEAVSAPEDAAPQQPEPETETTAEQPANIPSQQAELEAALAAAKDDAKKNFDKWQRALADFDNYKKRVERERVETYENAALEIIKVLLPVIDDFERALANVPPDLAGNPWLDGTSAIERKLRKLLETYEIEALDPVGEPFDPDKHQGLGVDSESDMASGHVTTTLQKGYVKGDKLLRPALVRIAG